MPLYIFVIFAMIVLDQAVKYWAVTVLKTQATIPVIEGMFHFTYVENRGAAFSLFAWLNSPWIFAVLAVIVSMIIYFVLRKDYVQTMLGRISLILVAAGALGNAVDRVTRGFVVDMFDFRFIQFPVFNIADILICTGGVLFVWYVMFQHKDPEEECLKKAGPADNTETGHEHE